MLSLPWLLPLFIPANCISREVGERELLSDLLSSYKPFGSPVRNHSRVLNVTVQPQIYSLVQVFGLEQNEQIRLLLWFPQSWQDEYLRWSPSQWGSIQKVNIPTSLIWMPDGYIFNTVDMKEPLTQLNARVRFDGKVEVDFNKLVDLRFPMDVLSFPFDEQLCSLQFGSWSYGISQLHYVIKPTTIPNIVRSNNTEWEVLNFTAEAMTTSYEAVTGEKNEYQEIFFRLRIRRKPLFYILVILIPTFVIVTISIVGIFTPHGIQGDREEKVSLGLTTLLTMAVILDMVTSEMPKSSAGLPLLGRFVLAETVICVLSITVSVLCIFCHERMLFLNRRLPSSLRFLFTEEQKKGGERSRLLRQNSAVHACLPPRLHDELRELLFDLHSFNRQTAEDDRIKTEWQRFFSVIDILSMVVWLSAIASLLFTCSLLRSIQK